MKTVLLLLPDEHFAALHEIAQRDSRWPDNYTVDQMILELTYKFREAANAPLGDNHTMHKEPA